MNVGLLSSSCNRIKLILRSRTDGHSVVSPGHGYRMRLSRTGLRSCRFHHTLCIICRQEPSQRSTGPCRSRRRTFSISVVYISCVVPGADLLMWRLTDRVRGVCLDDVVEEREACVETEGLKGIFLLDCSMAFALDYA